MTPSVFSVRPAAASEYLVRCAVGHRSSCVGTGLARQRVGELASKMLTKKEWAFTGPWATQPRFGGWISANA